MKVETWYSNGFMVENGSFVAVTAVADYVRNATMCGNASRTIWFEEDAALTPRLIANQVRALAREYYNAGCTDEHVIGEVPDSFTEADIDELQALLSSSMYIEQSEIVVNFGP